MQTTENVLLDFYSEYCMPCKRLMNDLDEISKRFENIEIKKVNIEENYELVEKYNVMSVPTLVFLQNNEVKDSYVGYRNKDHLEKFIEQHTK